MFRSRGGRNSHYTKREKEPEDAMRLRSGDSRVFLAPQQLEHRWNVFFGKSSLEAGLHQERKEM